MADARSDIPPPPLAPVLEAGDAPTGTLERTSSAPPRAPAVRSLAPGAVVDRYTVLERAGAGGMGRVFAAYDAKLDRKVALKMLRRGGAEYEARLNREAQAMARLSHPNVVALYDTGKVGDTLYLAMEFVRGETLRVWQKSAPRGLRDVVRAYTDAGNGLAAAHAAGLVHRDFKPDNVLVASDGQVKVTDFGIARAFGEQAFEQEALTPASAPRTGGSSLAQPVTAEGAMLGTPGYMAPEQLLCEGVDERTDQFAFCVSLYEALYGVRPFAPASSNLEQIAAATLAGTIDEPPKGANVPVHVRRVLLRGLSVAREARYPHMGELLADLGRDPAAKRRRVARLFAAIVASCTLVAAGARTVAAQRNKLCSATDTEAAEAWNPAIAAAAEHALLATSLPYAADTWGRTNAHLDGYMRKWKAMHKETCEATRVHGWQPESVMTLRMSCLDQRRNEVKALASVLSTADANVAAKALQAAQSLPNVDVCRDVASLSAVAPEPTDPAKRAELDGVRMALARVHENASAGRMEVARAEAAPLVARARALDYSPLLAEVLLESALTKAFSGSSREECIGEALEAHGRADAGRADVIRAHAAMLLAGCTEQAGSVVEAERWADIANGAVLRSGDRAELRAAWLVTVGHILHVQGKEEEAAARIREALELAKRGELPPEQLAGLERSLADREAYLGHKAEAERLVTEAEELVARAIGPEHPMRLRVMLSRQLVAGETGDTREGATQGLRAIALAEKIAPGGESAAAGYTNTCDDLSDLREYAQALPLCDRAVELMRALYGADGQNLALAEINLGFALLGLERHREALGHFEVATGIFQKTGTDGNSAYVEALAGKGEALTAMGRLREANELLEHATKLGLAATSRSRSLDGDQTRARAEFALAKARWARGERGARVSEPARDAATTFRRHHLGNQAKEVEDWLAAHTR